VYKIYFHAFRKFFLIKAVDLLGDHALCGHSFYMDMYYRKSGQEMMQDYLRLMPYLTVFGKEEMDIAHETRKQLLAIMGFKEEIKKMGDLSDEKVRQANRDRLLGGSTQHRQVVVGNGDVPKLLGSG
jgi:uncharacterized ubiquitin-like protein YukD